MPKLYYNMLLNSKEIQDRDIVQNSSPKHFKESSYNLRIGKIITHDGKILESIDLAPQGLITVISEEELHVPIQTLLIATVKNGLSQKGVLALNIGLIDSGWKGPINSTIINFGKGTFKLSKGDIFLRVTAYQYNALPQEAVEPMDTYRPDAYLAKTTTDIRAYLGEKFLSLDQTSKEIEKNVENAIWEGIKKLGSLFGLVSIVGVVIALLAFFANRVSDTTELTNKIIQLEIEKNVQTEKIKELEQKFDIATEDSKKKLDELLKRTEGKNE